MGEGPERVRPETAGGRPSVLGAWLPSIASRFARHGALGAVVVDAAALRPVEGQYGGEALRQVTEALRAFVADAVGDALGIDDIVVGGETGRSEIVVLVFRDANEVGFYRRELPDLRRCIADSIARRGQRVAYPYLRETPALPVGTGAALRNPTITAETQLVAALAEAREEAGLTALVAARRRRQRLFDLVVSRQITSVYEPIVEVESRIVFGYEALARGPEGSELHSPRVLFATATEQDLLFQLDCLCRQSGLHGARELPGGAKLFLNVRPTTIHDPAFRAESISKTLEACGLSPSDMVFEISEQESIGNFDIFREVRDYYRGLGFQIALDDTGAGYASLEAVMELSPDFIKVDRAFVHGIDEDPGRQELLRALHSVANRIGARIICEGLDTLEELATLGRLGIPFGQGWLFGKPHPLRSDV